MYCFFAHHRSASSSTNDILRELSRFLGWRHITVHNTAMFGNDLSGFCQSRRPDLLTFSNARGEYLKSLPTFRGIHMIRDPRDVLVSSYFSHRDSHPTDAWPALRAHRRRLQSVSREQGLLLEMDCREEQFTDLGSWPYNDDRILEWKMENFVADPARHFQQLISFWHIDISANNDLSSQLRPAVNRILSGLEQRLGGRLPRSTTHSISHQHLALALSRHSFEGKSGGRLPGETRDNHHYRKGLVGSWREHFSAELSERFKQRFGSLLVKLGYEQGLDW